MKNSDSTSTIPAALEKVTAAGIEIQQLQTLAADTGAELTALELSVDLADAEGLAKIGRLQTMMALIPHRQTDHETALAASQANLLKVCYEFIAVTLSPRLGDLMKRTRAKVRAELMPHFTHSWELEAAIEKTVLVAECQGIYHLVTISDPPMDQVPQYAARLLQTWQDAEVFENGHLA
jgi:hypothetical protein